MRLSSGCGTDGCGRTSATSRPSTMPSPPSIRPSGSAGRRSSAFVRKNSLTHDSRQADRKPTGDDRLQLSDARTRAKEAELVDGTRETEPRAAAVLVLLDAWRGRPQPAQAEDAGAA